MQWKLLAAVLIVLGTDFDADANTIIHAGRLINVSHESDSVRHT